MAENFQESKELHNIAMNDIRLFHQSLDLINVDFLLLHTTMK